MGTEKKIIKKPGSIAGTVVISRKEALRKAGKYAAFTAGAMMFFFSPKKAQAASDALPEDLGRGW